VAEKDLDEDNGNEAETSVEKDRGMPGFKFATVLVIVALLIGGGIYLFIYRNDEVTDVTGQISAGEEMYQIRIDCWVATGSPNEFTGKVNLVVDDPDGERCYTSKISIKEGHGDIILDFSDFVWGNGNYTFTVSAEGLKQVIEYEISTVVESVEIWVTHEGHNTDPKLSIFLLDKDGKNLRHTTSQEYLTVSYDIEITNERGSMISESKSEVRVSDNHFDYEFERFGTPLAGNYTFNITITNTITSQDSPYRRVYLEQTERLDIEARAHPGGPYSTSVTQDVILDATGSVDDGEITKYSWFFEDWPGKNHEEGPDDEDFGIYNAGRFTQGTHTVTLVVTDDDYPDPKNATIQFSITVTLL